MSVLKGLESMEGMTHMTCMTTITRSRRGSGRRAGAAARSGFTLLELLITIGIIALLAGIVLAVGSAVLRNAEARQVEASFRGLDEAVGEFERARGQKITYRRLSGDPDGNYDCVEQNITQPYLIVQLLNGRNWAANDYRPLVAGNDRALEILKRIDPDLLRRDITTVPPVGTGVNATPAPRLELVDPWGTRIGVVFPGRSKNPGETGDADGTVRTSDENSLGVCRDGRICFVSAGPDGNFGTREDNLTSYELIWPLPALQ